MHMLLGFSVSLSCLSVLRVSRLSSKLQKGGLTLLRRCEKIQVQQQYWNKGILVLIVFAVDSARTWSFKWFTKWYTSWVSHSSYMYPIPIDVWQSHRPVFMPSGMIRHLARSYHLVHAVMSIRRDSRSMTWAALIHYNGQTLPQHALILVGQEPWQRGNFLQIVSVGVHSSFTTRVFPVKWSNVWAEKKLSVLTNCNYINYRRN
jgi:hypothetical protein